MTSASGRSFFVAIAAASLLLPVGALTHCVTDSNGGLVVTDGGVLNGEAATPYYAVSGTVSGLAAGGTVTLLLNGANQVIAKNGPFSFPPVLLDMQSYAVTASAATGGFTCVVTKGSGDVSAANVAGVTVTCTSSNATLTSLALSTTPLTPAFSPSTLAYAASVRVFALFPSASSPATTLTAVPRTPARRSPSAASRSCKERRHRSI
jgi:hypothetical protein